VAAATEPEGILHRLRVLDLAQSAAGQLAARQLAESGAEVVRLASSGDDPVRQRSKARLTLDLDASGDRERLTALLAGADVLVHDLGPSRAKALGLDGASLSARFPQLVACAVTAFPGTGPEADMPCADSLVLARAGMLDEFMGLSRAEGPVYLRVPFATLGAARLAVVGVLARLIARRRDGRGGVVRTSLLQGALASMSCLWARAEAPSFSYMSRTLSRRSPAEGGFGNPRYRCADGLWMQIVGAPDFLPLMAEALRELGEAPPTPPEQGVRGAAFGYVGLAEPLKARAFALRPRAAWLEALWGADVPAFPCLELGEIYADEQARLNGFSVRVEDEAGQGRWQPGAPYRTDPPSRIRPSRDADPAWPPHPPREVAAGPARPPLAGIRVLDLGQYIAGPFSAMILADLGAEVIKVEPVAGDGLRPPAVGAWRPARSFAAGNRGKRTLAIDLKDPEARPVVHALAAWADVVHHNVRLAAVRRLGLDYETLSAGRPELVYCHIDAYGAKGPRADWPGFDPLAQAASGWETEAAGEGNPPMWMRNAYMDYHCGLQAAAAALLAIYRRQATGQGQFCSASLLGECLQSIGEVTMDDAGAVSARPRLDAAQTGPGPFDRLYRCEDGRWLALLARTEGERAALLAAFDAASPQALEAAVGGWPRDYALTRLREAGVPAEPARQDQMDAFFDSAWARDQGLVTAYDSREWGRMEQVGALWDFGDLPLSLGRPPPALGEHTAEICAELRVDENLTARLLARGVLRG
jgi:crotonobetainyl-CoA:carnitine CoA-transferase CaiB-like acyl-CoA transferase